VNRVLKGRIVEHFGNQWAFSQAVKMHESDVSRVVRGRRSLPVQVQKEWAGLLKSTPQELFDNGQTT
jgi:hypothetical protein